MCPSGFNTPPDYRQTSDRCRCRNSMHTFKDSDISTLSFRLLTNTRQGYKVFLLTAAQQLE